jgi:hypothetical protein
MSQPAELGTVALVLVVCLIWIFLELHDVRKILERIESHLSEANDADPHIRHRRELRRMGIHEDPTKDFRP